MSRGVLSPFLRFGQPQPLTRVWRRLMAQMTAEAEPVLPAIMARGQCGEMAAVLRAQNGRGLHVQLIVTPLTEQQTAAMLAAPEAEGKA
jgi:hypothetical protein